MEWQTKKNTVLSRGQTPKKELQTLCDYCLYYSELIFIKAYQIFKSLHKVRTCFITDVNVQLISSYIKDNCQPQCSAHLCLPANGHYG